jgi:hypothetical protein
MASPVPSANGSLSDDRLDGWKEIAAYIKRGVRTAQRWERELGMPVHRLNTGGADVVFARRTEIDLWLRLQVGEDLTSTDADRDEGPSGSATADVLPDATRPVPARRSFWLRWAGLAAGAALAGVAAGVWLFAGRSGPASPPPGPAQPAAVTFSGSALNAIGPVQEVLWEHRFPGPVSEFNPDHPELIRRSWAALDFDNDGSSEVLFARADPEDPRFYCFNSDGSVRFAGRIDTAVRFGDYSCPPVQLTHVFAESRRDFPGTFFVAGQHPLFFPAVVRRLDARGNAAGEYWSNGYVRLIKSVQIGGRPATVVGAANNETGGASLAVFFGNIGGSAPSAQAAYRCSGCSEGGPDIFLVFPRFRVQEELSFHAVVLDVTPVGPDRLSVSVVNAGLPEVRELCCGHAYYILDKDFRVVSTEVGETFTTLQQRLELEGRVTTATRLRGSADFYPVRRWNGSGWDLITGPETPVRR